MNWADERAAIEQQLTNGFTDAPIQYPGVPYSPQPDTAWVRLKIVPTTSHRITLGPNGETRVLGTIAFQIFAPVNQGSQAARALADTLSSLFIEAQFSSGSSGVITCWQPELHDFGPTADGGWYQVNLMIPYFRDVVV